MLNPRTQKGRTVITLCLMVFILSCLVFMLFLLPSKTDSKVESDQYMPPDTKLTPENKATSSSDEVESVVPVKKGKIAIVIDDAGYNLTKLKRLLDFPGKLTIAVLPQVTYSAQSAELINRAGKEVILHLPMQPQGNENPGPGAITTDLDTEEIIATLTFNLSTVPYAIGMNNHMGSLATTDERVVAIILNYCKEHDLFFLDSKTTPHSVITKLAADYVLPVLSRDIFLDNEKDKADIKNSLIQGLELAHRHGSVIMIGHLGDEMTDVLNQMYPLLIKQGYELVTASELLKH